MLWMMHLIMISDLAPAMTGRHTFTMTLPLRVCRCSRHSRLGGTTAAPAYVCSHTGNITCFRQRTSAQIAWCSTAGGNPPHLTSPKPVPGFCHASSRRASPRQCARAHAADTFACKGWAG